MILSVRSWISVCFFMFLFSALGLGQSQIRQPHAATFASNQARVKTTLHVTGVRYEDAKDWCEGSDTCFAKRFRVEGYTGAKNTAGSIEYVAQCVEVRDVNPATHALTQRSGSCPRVHAHEDYLVYVFDDSLNFDLGGQTPPTGFVLLYDIVSETEAVSRVQ